MLSRLFVLLACLQLASLVLAQEMPDCAAECLVTHLEDSSCSATDFDCICSDETLMGNVELCSLGTCTLIEGLGKHLG